MIDRLRSLDRDTRLLIWLSPFAIPLVVGYVSTVWTLIRYLEAFGRAAWAALAG